MVVWHAATPLEVDDARAIFDAHMADDDLIVDSDGNVLDEFDPRLEFFKVLGQQAQKPSQMLLQILDESGDQRIIWDAEEKAEVAKAAKKFADYLERGWKAYAIDVSGKKGKRIHSFDPEREEILFDDRTTKQKLADFAKSFKSIRMLPKTLSG